MGDAGWVPFPFAVVGTARSKNAPGFVIAVTASSRASAFRTPASNSSISARAGSTGPTSAGGGVSGGSGGSGGTGVGRDHGADRTRPLCAG